MRTCSFLFFLAFFCRVAVSQIAPCENLFEERQFKQALDCVNNRLASGTLLYRTDSLKAFELGGVLSYMIEDFEGANRYFDQVIRTDSSIALDPLTVPPEIIALFDNRKIAFKQPALKPFAPSHLLPFGIGHLRAKKKGRGLFYLSASVLCLGTNVATYWARKANETSDGHYSNVQKNIRLYNIQQASFYGGFIGIGITSFIDALITR